MAPTGFSAPLSWLIAATVAAGGSIVIGALASFRPVLATIGWLLAGFGAIGLVTMFTLKDARLRTDPWYLERDLGRWLRIAVFVVALAGIALNAWRFADYVSRLQVF